MQLQRIVLIAIFVFSAITCFTTGFAVTANVRLQSCCQQHCSIHRIPHFERPLDSRLSFAATFAANAQQEDSDGPEISSREEKAAIPINTTETQPKNISTSRAGGRVASSSRDVRRSAGASGSIVLSLGRQAIPLLVAWLFLQMLFGGIGGLIYPRSSSYVFYQSSVYESRVYTSDGNVETKREESIRSNLPSLLERQVESGQSSSYRSKVYRSQSSQLMDEANDEFDRALEDMMRF